MLLSYQHYQELQRPLEWVATPSLRLQPYVERYWGLIIPPCEPLNFGYRVSPSGNVFLQFVFGPCQTLETQHAYKLGNDELARPNNAIILPRDVSWRVKLEESHDFVLVKFKPGMAAPFLNLSLSELDVWENTCDVWSNSITEQFCDMQFASVEDRVQIIEQTLLRCLESSRLKFDQTVSHAVDLIHQRRGVLEIRTLADQLHISGRQLRRKFQQYVGHTPKQYNNIVRFLNANRLMKRHPAMTLTEVAHRSGYFDLSHFTNAIREVTGISPTQMSQIDQRERQMHEEDVDSVACPVG